MKSNKLLIASSLIALLTLTACGEKSIQFYASNPDETKKALTKCHSMGLSQINDKNCLNAIEGNAIAYREKEKIAAKIRSEALQKWVDEAQAQSKKK